MRTLGTITSLCVLLVAPALAQSPEDYGEPGTGFIEAITPATCPGALVELDFDALPQGPVTVADIQAAFPGTMLSNITFTTPTSTAGVYNTDPQGRALAGDPSGSLALYLVDPPTGDFGAMGDMIVDFSNDVMESGVQVADWLGPVNIEIFDDGGSVGMVQFDSSPMGVQFCFQSDVPFDSMTVSANPDSPGGNWVVPAIWVMQGAPTMGEWGYVLLIATLVLVSLWVLRRKLRQA